MIRDRRTMEQESKDARLVVTSAGAELRIVEIGERLTIGRSASNVLILADQKASRIHAEIRDLGGGRYRLSDVGSANGTWHNGQRMTAPKDLRDGDQIEIGAVRMRFVAPAEPVENPPSSVTSGTALDLRSELVIVLVSDIRNYTTMSEALPAREFSQLMTQWFRETTEIIDANGGTVDKFIGDAVMAYWVVTNKSDPAKEVNSALATARSLVRCAGRFSDRLTGQFAGYRFGVGVGINLGQAMLCNAGTAKHQSFTAVGDTVNVAFRLEPLTKARGYSVIVSGDFAAWASSEYQFHALGQTEVKGRKQPVPILGLELPPEEES